ncbi:MAG: hypothetical protein U0931_27430 [Vulcanimicrobiota bacterium]
MPAPEEDEPISFFWHLGVLAVALLVVAHGDSLPRLLVWPAWGLLGLVSLVIHVAAGGAVWVACALPYRGLSPVAGGPGMRAVEYHPQLQQRVGQGSQLDWLNWWAGLFLRGGVFVAALVATVLSVASWVPNNWGLAGFLLAWHLGVILGGLLASPGITLLMIALRGFWHASEPPELEQEPGRETEGIGMAPPEPGWKRRLLALTWRVTPLPTLLLALTAGPLLAFPEHGPRLAWLGLALGAVLGYPVWAWSQYWARRQ